ncbi:sulfite oxidase-like oxidoreductase [Phycicoccus sp. MAQZ13P-2]|uniref:sulfite oxidase-like oxidoreductase n=1 Tax=Phycicoccus mangrovi TaxID=2840470 RepID=UPI001BFFEAC7|nr:sulfite oxidase-like oxidoreductase [Phycicoccus mangrovi]MBT9255010.1 sulfite oxidase-like oxidoreductase [Phycicoccus mangrovi]MBT9255993.1 sulfite oxidase-like oxidoreductase [Phycicoccus mangrovi]MBT9273994.1 sulfite oxidase-like oxidoreductase [Phycicoccus mangrovi]
MDIVTRGFVGRRSGGDPRIPPGQYLERDFPVLSAGPTPVVRREDWTLRVEGVDGSSGILSWADLHRLPVEDVRTDIHCVTKWSKLDTSWRGVDVEAVLAAVGVGTQNATHVLVHAHGGYTTNLPLADLRGGRAWIATEYEGASLAPEHGGPARLLVPHLYFWKSAKWVSGLQLLAHDRPGFWEQLGYHEYGDPWREQRYVGD